MSTRKIKDAKDLETNELIYLRGHAKATYMSDGRNVEDVINSIGTGGGIDLSNYATKTELEGKVDKVTGKQLSTEDFTTALKDKLQSLSNYDDTALEAAISQLRSDFDTLVSGDTTTAIKTFNDVIAFLSGISDTESLDSIIASIEQQIASKQDEITDLDTIRANAAKGATALQSSGGTMTGEIKFNIADLIYKEISAGIIAAFKVPRAQINELISNYIYLGSASQGNSSDSSLVIRKYSSITDKSPSGTTDLVTINTSGNVTAVGGFTGNLTGTATKATTADSSTKSTQDGNGNVIADTYANKVSVINHGTNDTTYTLTPNTLHVWDSVASLDLTFGAVDNTIYNEFMFQFSSGSNPTTLILPDSIKWVAEPAIEANKIYQCSIVNNIGVIASVDNV